MSALQQRGVRAGQRAGASMAKAGNGGKCCRAGYTPFPKGAAVSDDLLAEMRDLVWYVSPELKAQPLYLCWRSDIPDLPLTCCLGQAFAGPVMDMNIADALGDQYTKPGPVIMLDRAAIDAAANPGAFVQCLRSVTLHETGHVLPSQPVVEPPEFPPDFPKVRDVQLKLMTDVQSAPQPAAGAKNDVHDWRFIRRAIHLWCRAAEGGFGAPLMQLLGYGHYHEQVYLEILLPEIHAMRFASFDEIEKTPPPPALLTQCCEVQRWLNRHKGKEHDDSTRIAARA